MKQPELGKRLSTLRHENGLTQQEVADKSGINIRTIQRIESGEASPRTYTVKQYLSAMDLEYGDIMNGYKQEGNSVYKTAWILGIVCFIVGFPESYFSSLLIEGNLTSAESFFFILIKIISVISYVYFIRGFYRLGNDNQFPLMAVSALFLIIGAMASGLFEIIAVYQVIPFESVIFFESIFFGIISILFGVSLFKSEQFTGRYGVLAGILEVLAGITFLTFILGFIGLFIQVPAEILEILILYFAANKISQVQMAR